MSARRWRCKESLEVSRSSHQDFEDAKRCWQNLEDVRRMPPRLWHWMDMPLEERWCNTNFRCLRKVTLSKFWRHDVKLHHSEGRWCGSNFRVVKWHNLEERRCSLDLQGTRRCPQEISDAKHTSKMWEDVHRRWATPYRLHSIMIFEHHVVSNWLILSDALPIKGFLKARWWPMEKLFKLDRQFFFFSCDWT